jgi:hypothetical protein
MGSTRKFEAGSLAARTLAIVRFYVLCTVIGSPVLFDWLIESRSAGRLGAGDALAAAGADRPSG